MREFNKSGLHLGNTYWNRLLYYDLDLRDQENSLSEQKFTFSGRNVSDAFLYTDQGQVAVDSCRVLLRKKSTAQ